MQGLMILYAHASDPWSGARAPGDIIPCCIVYMPYFTIPIPPYHCNLHEHVAMYAKAHKRVRTACWRVSMRTQHHSLYGRLGVCENQSAISYVTEITLWPESPRFTLAHPHLHLEVPCSIGIKLHVLYAHHKFWCWYVIWTVHVKLAHFLAGVLFPRPSRWRTTIFFCPRICWGMVRPLLATDFHFFCLEYVEAYGMTNPSHGFPFLLPSNTLRHGTTNRSRWFPSLLPSNMLRHGTTNPSRGFSSLRRPRRSWSWMHSYLAWYWSSEHTQTLFNSSASYQSSGHNTYFTCCPCMPWRCWEHSDHVSQSSQLLSHCLSWTDLTSLPETMTYATF